MAITYELIDVLFRAKVPLIATIIMAFRALLKVFQKIIWTELNHDKIWFRYVQGLVKVL